MVLLIVARLDPAMAKSNNREGGQGVLIKYGVRLSPRSGHFVRRQFTDPVRVVAFNTLECRANDVSRNIARLIQDRCDIAGNRVPDHVRDFAERLKQIGAFVGRLPLPRARA